MAMERTNGTNVVTSVSRKAEEFHIMDCMAGAEHSPIHESNALHESNTDGVDSVALALQCAIALAVAHVEAYACV